MTTDYSSMKNSELVSAYNTMAETAGLRGIEVTKVTRFKDHAIGVQRCEKLEKRLENHAAGGSAKGEEPKTEPPEGSSDSDPNPSDSPSSAEPDQTVESDVAKKAKTAKKNGNGAKKKAAPKRAAKKQKEAKPKFGFDKTITEVGECTRFKGSKAEGLYKQMANYMSRHPGASVAEVIEKTDYRRQDYEWDLERKSIKVKNL